MASCPYERSLRSQPCERPQPLKRGQGVGGGNYRRIQSAGAVSGRSRTCQAPIRPSSACRPRSTSSTSSRPNSLSSVASSSCPQPLMSKCNRPSARAQRPPQRKKISSSPRSVCEPVCGPSNGGIARASNPRSSSSGPTSRCDAQPDPAQDKNALTTCSISRSRKPSGCTNYPENPSMRRSIGDTPSRSSAPRNVAARNRQASGNSRSCTTMQFSSPKPGPSCLRAPPNGAKRKVQFIGLPPNGPGPCTDSRSRYQSMTVSQARNGRRKRNGNSICEPAGGPREPTYGPSQYPLVPDQYETPYVSLPGPLQVLLMPGDIDPNETTIIDIVGLSEGDIEEVPCMPSPAPASLLEDTWNEYLKDVSEQCPNRQKGCNEMKMAKKKPCSPSRNKKKKEQLFLPCAPKTNFICQGKAFSFEEYGNVRVDDPNCPPYEGPSFKAPDPECQRARPFTYKSRKTTTRSLTDDERRAIEEAGMYRAIRAIINEHDAKWERDRAARGLTGDELMDIDNDDCVPTGSVEKAKKDIFATTDQCGFGESYLPRSPKISPIPTRSQCQRDDLIAWDANANIPCPTRNDEPDFLTRTPPRSPKKQVPFPSPNLMSMCEPDEDLLGLRTPPKTKSPSPCKPLGNRDDLIRWESPQAALPFDVACEENLFDNVTRPSPTAARLKTPLSSRNNGKGGQTFSSSCKPCDFPGNSQKEPRIVRAIPMEGDANTVVLENSPLASRCSPDMQDSDDNDSLDILDYENPCDGGNVQPWQQMDNFEEEFNRPLPKTVRPCYNPEMSGVALLNDCEDEDDDDLDILDENCLPDFECSMEAEQTFREEAKYQTMFQPLAAGVQYLDSEECPFESEFEELERQFEDERGDLLNLCHEPEFSPIQKRDFGRFGSELVEQCRDPIEQCQDLLRLMEPCNGTPPKRMGPFSRELLDSCPDEQQLIDVYDDCEPEQPSCPPRFGYSRDLFTNVQWDPCMAKKSSIEGQCPQ